MTSSSSASVNVTDSTTGTSYTVTDQNGKSNSFIWANKNFTKFLLCKPNIIKYQSPNRKNPILLFEYNQE